MSLSPCPSLKLKQYLMSVKKKNSLPMNPYSWEERAFAEDAQGPLGAFVWPPRSYSCSFCRREFRSAQALGGHMNVHRREKAKLKRTTSPSLGQESLDSSSDTKSCVYDEDLVVGKRDAETSLVLGLIELDSCSNTGVGKRRRADPVTVPAIMRGGIDLELRLASFNAW